MGVGVSTIAPTSFAAVGSKSVTLKQAILIASVFEFAGAVLMGSLVTDTVRKKIVSQDIFVDDPGALILGMLCADLASALWPNTCSFQVSCINSFNYWSYCWFLLSIWRNRCCSME